MSAGSETLDPQDEVLDLGDRTSVRRNNKGLKRKALEADAVVRSMLTTEEQRAWWWNLIARCGVFQADLLPGDALQFATGQRNIGLLLLAAIPADLFHMMMSEANLKDKQDA